MGLCRNWGVAEIKERGLRGKEEERQETESLSVYDCDLKKMVISTKIKISSVFNSRNSSVTLITPSG